ncbi:MULTISPECIES: T9SS type A sorting domain-containing protein [Flavobacteriaceae]|uniref:T9SS type A sorting domain-containing protein n=1 Tax=Flavobacteriaceae TaxID=49546 RepID=UPI001490D3E6|nr:MULTISPECIES: T9SS type A sorting domain-containing protein [Allomuricauda]MDC6367549.1 thrombospondin type 3 repeat-containing protein [Muricauda sp. AC10]
MTDKLLSIFLLLLFFSFSIVVGQTIDTELLELKFSNDGYPERFTRAGNGFYFTADDSELWYTDGTLEGTQFFSKSTNSGDISLILPQENGVFFVAEKDYRTDELWVSDGTEEGTIQLTDRNLSFSQDGSIRDAIVFGNKVLFSLFDETYGKELWISDGTIEGTRMLKDINEGENHSSPSDFLLFNERIFFKASTEESGLELWVSDGTTDGTIMFKDINVGDQSSMASSSGYKIYNDNFYFFANNGVVGNELWKSDGTSDGTILVKDINEGSLYNSGGSFIQGGILNGKLLFLANDGVHGTELWQTDGTAEGTTIFYDIAEGQYSSFGYSTQLIFSDSKAFFYATDNAQNSGLWVSDGTISGTNFLRDTSVSNLTFDELGESIFFFGDNDSGYKKILWKSDGTVQGTQVVSQKATGTNISSHENDITVLNDRVFFAGETERNGIELWISDGSDEGTSLFYDFNSSYGVIPSLLTAVGDRLFFRGNQYGYYGLCTSDGTIDGTKYLDINLDGQSIDEDSEFIDFNGKLVVSANDGIHGYELWISDGTQEGTKMIKDINPGRGNSMNLGSKFTVINERFYFMADDGINGFEPWTSDGTEAGTYMIKNIHPGTFTLGGNPSYPGYWVEKDGFIYFSAVYSFGNGSWKTALYKTDNTPQGTSKIADIGGTVMIEVLGDKILVANSRNDLYEEDDHFYVWVYDTITESFTQLNTSLEFYNSAYVSVLNGYVYYYGQSNGVWGLCKTDGTDEGTTVLFFRSEHPFNNLEISRNITCGDYIYFTLQPGLSSDKELWRTNGTVEGTIPIISEQEGVFNSIGELECFNGNLVFKQYAKPEPIWLTTGKPDEVYGFDINVVNSQSSPSSINYPTAAGNKLFFSANTSLSGSEIYVTSSKNFVADNDLTDSDGDGVIDLFDECPDTLVGEEINDVGCAQSQLDDDNDGVTNDMDQCPKTLPNEVVDANGCSESDLLDTDGDGIVDSLDLCPQTPMGESVNENGCGQSQLDDDQDGVMNDRDLCPETLPIYTVDSDGCPVIFELPANNFSIETIGVTCVDKNNGQLLITANENHDYTARINNDDYNFATELTIQNLHAGKYELCFTIADKPDYIKCFSFEIAEPSEVTGKSSSSISNQKLMENIEMFSGTAPYTVSVNGSQQLTTMSSSFSVEVKHGDLVQVMSKFPCEGVFERKIEITEGMSFAPNPTTDDIYIYMQESHPPDINVSIYNSDLKLVRSGLLEVINGTLKVSMESLSSGIYYIRIGTGNSNALKIIKK